MRLAGHASARTAELLDRAVVSRLASVAVLIGLDLLEHPVGQPFAGEEHRADPDPDRGLDRLQPDPEGEAQRVADAVLGERDSDPGLDEPDVARARTGTPR